VTPLAEYNVRFKRNVYFILAFAVLSLSVLFAAGTIFTLTVALAIDETSVGHIYLGGELVTFNPKRHGKLTGVTAI